MNIALRKKLSPMFSDLEMTATGDGDTIISVSKGSLLSLLSFLKSQGYEHLGLISCVDWIEQEEFELVYIVSPYMSRDHEHETQERSSIIVKTRIPREDPQFLTVIPVYQNAEPYERELHELFGIHFEGHPRLMPLLLEREYPVPPFRKDFDTRKYVQEIFDSIPPIENPEK
jgi:NADH-quinone oxidoreductase subunit C